MSSLSDAHYFEEFREQKKDAYHELRRLLRIATSDVAGGARALERHQAYEALSVEGVDLWKYISPTSVDNSTAAPYKRLTAQERSQQRHQDIKKLRENLQGSIPADCTSKIQDIDARHTLERLQAVVRMLHNPNLIKKFFDRPDFMALIRNDAPFWRAIEQGDRAKVGSLLKN